MTEHIQKRVKDLEPGDILMVATDRYATVERVGEITRYDYHDAPDWVWVSTKEYFAPFHFDGGHVLVSVKKL